MTDKIKYIHSPTGLKNWFLAAKPGHQAVYHSSDWKRDRDLFKAARKYFDLDGVILYQRPSDYDHDVIEWVAQRCSSRAAAWVARMSASVPSPYNRYAHEASA